MEDEVVRGSIILHKGQLMWPPPPPKVVASPPPSQKKELEAAEPVKKEVTPFKDNLNTSLMTTAGKHYYLRNRKMINTE